MLPRTALACTALAVTALACTALACTPVPHSALYPSLLSVTFFAIRTRGRRNFGCESGFSSFRAGHAADGGYPIPDRAKNSIPGSIWRSG